MTPHEWMRRGVEPDAAAWCSAVESKPFMRAITWGASSWRYSGPRRWIRGAVLIVACWLMHAHRVAWRLGLRL